MRQVQVSRVRSIVLASVMLGGFLLAWRTLGTHTLMANRPASKAVNRAIPVTVMASLNRQPEAISIVANSEVDSAAIVARKTPSPKATVTATEPATEPATVVETPAQQTEPRVAAVAQQTNSPLPQSAYLDGIRHQQQTWNNCGPATLSMMLSYYKGTDTQQVIAQAIKPYKDDKNVSPDALVGYAESAGFRARILVGGDIQLLKALVANQIPVIVESWFIPEPGDEMGHYQLLVGYDGDTLTFYDSYHGPDVQHSVHEFDALWKVFNRLAVLVWKPEQDAQMQALLGPRWDEAQMKQIALDTARQDTTADPRDKFAWFNIGSTLLSMGDQAGAVDAFDNAIALKLPWRMMWYQFGPYEANYLAGHYDKVVQLTSATLRVRAGLEESYYWRGRAYAAQGKTKSARTDFNQALVYRANYAAARSALDELAQ